MADLSSTAGPQAPSARPRRIWDVVLTIILLLIGLLGVALALFTAAFLSDVGVDLDDGFVRASQLTMVISHLLLYVLAAGVSAVLMATRRIAFWVPLAAGAIAAGFYWTVLIVMSAATGNPL